MNMANWKYFKIREFFDKPYKGTAYNAQDLILCSPEDANAIRYVTRTDDNNGCKGFVINVGFEDIEKGNAITIGDTTSTIYYQSKDFICGDHIVILRSKYLNETRGLFIVSLLNLERYRYNYGRAYKKELIYDTKIKLPVDSDDNPDWDWIENYVKDTLIPELPKKAKSIWQKQFNNTPLSSKKLKLNIRDWQWFKVGELFKLEKCKCSNATELLEEGDEIAYIGAKKNDNGIMNHVKRNDEFVTKGHCIVFIGDGQGSVGYATYQPIDFIGSTTLIAGYNDKLNAYNALFLVGVLDQERYRYSFGRKYKKEIIATSQIKLPAIKNARGEYEPDWQWMEDYIKGLPYSSCLEN